MAKVVNATGIVGTNVFPFASLMLMPMASVRPGLPSLKMITPLAPAASAFWILTPKLHEPRWINAIWPAENPLKSALVQPLDELGAGVGGRMMPPAG